MGFQDLLAGFFCENRSRNATVRVPTYTQATGHHLRTIQTIAGNVYVWLVGPRRLVSER